MNINLRNIRQEYQKGVLNKASLPADPFVFFDKWLKEAIAADLEKATAVIVSTVSADGKPSMRCVLLKEVKDEKFVFYTNYDSRKGQQIANNPSVALTFFWNDQDRQVHIEGIAEKLSAEESNSYFASRPYTSRIGARISPQSRVIKSRIQLMRDFVKESARWVGKEVQRPANWGGYAITPSRIEFFQGRVNRLHDRFLYEKKENGEWSLERLAP